MKIVIYPREHHFRLVGGDTRLGERFRYSERRLYPVTSRIVSDVCQVYYAEESGARTLDCHNQASFRRLDEERDSDFESKAEGERIPDCAAFIFDENSDGRPLILCFWVEVKRLVSIDWSVPDANVEALLILQEAIPQLREQANYAFTHYPGPATYDAFVQVGPFWTHLKFSKDLEDRADERIANLIRQAEAAVDAGQDFPPVRSVSPASGSTPPRKRRKTKKSELVTPASFDDCFPSVSFCNTRIVDFVEGEYNPLFLKAVHDVLTPHGFRAQHSWFSYDRSGQAYVSQEHRGAPAVRGYILLLLSQSSHLFSICTHAQTAVQRLLRRAYQDNINARISKLTKGSRDTSGTYPSRPARQTTRSRSRHSESASVSVPVSDHEEEEEETDADEHVDHGLLPADDERDASVPPLSNYSDESDGIGAPDVEDEDDDLYE